MYVRVLTSQQYGGAVLLRGGGAVPRQALAADEVLGALALLDELLRRHAEQLHDARHLVRLVLAGE